MNTPVSLSGLRTRRPTPHRHTAGPPRPQRCQGRARRGGTGARARQLVRKPRTPSPLETESGTPRCGSPHTLSRSKTAENLSGAILITVLES